MKVNRMAVVYLACLGVLGLCACASQEFTPGLKVPQSLADVYRMGKSSHGQTIQLQAQFQGWSACASSVQNTRSDWVIEQGDVCMFVSGALPQGIVAPPSTASRGMPVFLDAQVMWSEATGKPYLKRLK